MRNTKKKKTTLKTSFRHPSLLSRFSFTAHFFPSFPQAAQGNMEWGLQSVPYTLSLMLLPFHILPLLYMVGLPQNILSQTSPVWVHKKFGPLWFLAMGCSPSGTDCSSFAPPQDHISLQKTCFCVGSSLFGLARSLLQCRLFTGHSSFKALSNCSSVGPFRGCK